MHSKQVQLLLISLLPLLGSAAPTESSMGESSSSSCATISLKATSCGGGEYSSSIDKAHVAAYGEGFYIGKETQTFCEKKVEAAHPSEGHERRNYGSADSTCPKMEETTIVVDKGKATMVRTLIIQTPPPHQPPR